MQFACIFIQHLKTKPKMNKPKQQRKQSPIKVNYFEPTERARKNPRNINALMFIYERVKPNWGYPIDPVKKLLSPYLMKHLINDLNEAGHRAPRGGEFTSMQVYRLLDRLHWIADFYE